MYIVCDIGGTNMRVAAVSNDTLGAIKKVPTPKDPQEAVKLFAELARECAGSEKITAVAGCVAGTVSSNGVISDAHNLREWEGRNIVKEFSDALRVPVTLVNDAGLVGLGEASVGAGKGSPNLVYVTVSTGVGGAHIVNGQIVEAGGIAETKVDGASLEDLVSGTAVMKKFGIHPKDLDSLDIRNGLADTLAKGLCAVVERWSPKDIVLGGSMIVGVNPIPIARVEESLRALLQTQTPSVKMAALGDNGGLLGGIALLKQTA